MRRLVPLLLFAATFSFALGAVLPLIRIDRLFFLTDEPSLIGIVVGLWSDGDALLAAIVALFSIVFPSIKLVLLHIAAYDGPDGHRLVPDWFRALANWSMLDVVLVALVIFAAKTSGVATAFTQPGLWFFAGSVLCTAITSALVRKATG